MSLTMKYGKFDSTRERIVICIRTDVSIFTIDSKNNKNRRVEL